jgi:3-oxoacyl-[acyl-carrier protein] reductase
MNSSFLDRGGKGEEDGSVQAMMNSDTVGEPHLVSGELDGQVALVTGAGRNIGRAIALELAAHGASIGVNVRANLEEAKAVQRAIELGGGRAVTTVGDIGDRRNIESIVSTVQDALGPITLLICNAGIRNIHPALETTVEEWDQLVDVNLSSTLHLVQAVVGDMRKASFGRIVAITGIVAHYTHYLNFNATVDRAHLAATQAGVEALLRALAPQLARDGITCNAVAPGPIATDRPRPTNLPSTAAGRIGTPEDVAYLCRVLCSPKASYVTGQVILADGGGPGRNDL